ncbi:ROK family transcriptional regulator [Microbacterium marmarense]|uniref:ROK family transcriptional regulator n=1 Tax=Microbacterium marmarense TaxID=3122051 RepID=A0ABU8LX70_9MICO
MPERDAVHEAGKVHSGTASRTMVDEIRRQNLRQVLLLAHRSGPLSRAELTRATGLNRSTIGGLVAELQERGLVHAHAATPTRKVGRPSAAVSASTQTVAIAVNPEVDTIDVALVSLGGRVVHRVRYANDHIPTPAEFVNIVGAIIEGMRPDQLGLRSVGVGLAIPGLVREADGRVLLAPHLDWRDVPVAAMLEAKIGLPVVGANDANCGILAEVAFGAASGTGVIVYLNGGASGIGSGIVIDGQLIRGSGGHAGEFGHTLVNSMGSSCHCGAVGCLETEVRLDRLIAAAGARPSTAAEMNALVSDAWHHPQSACGRELHRQLPYLATAFRTIINALNPVQLVLGGYLAAILLAAGETALTDRIGPSLPGAREEVSLAATQLGDGLLLIGAAELVFAPLVDDPASQQRVDGAIASNLESRPALKL